MANSKNSSRLKEILISIVASAVTTLCCPLVASGQQITSFDPAVVFSGTSPADQESLDALVGIVGYEIEDFEDETLIPGLSIEGITPESTLSATVADNPSVPNCLWDGQATFLRFYTSPEHLVFRCPAGTTSFGVGIGDIETDIRIFVNGVHQGPVRALPNYRRETDNAREIYIRIDAEFGSSIEEVRFVVFGGGNDDGLFFDHLAIGKNRAPIADAGQDRLGECTGLLTPIQLDGTLSSDPDGDAIEYEWAVPEGSQVTLDDPNNATPIGMFPLGPTLVTLTVTDGNGGMDVADVLVTVEDTTPPVLVCTTDKIALWPPNHAIHDVWICIAASDACSNPDDLQITCTMSSNEPDDANGDGSTTGDVDGFDGFTAPVPVANLVYDETNECFYGLVSLRAERDGTDEGRVYSIVCNVVDDQGNEATASCVVIVPHNKRKN